jgi:hypothetical protein
VQGEGRLLRGTLSIEGMHARLVSRIAVGNKAKGWPSGSVRAASPRATVAARVSRSEAT